MFRLKKSKVFAFLIKGIFIYLLSAISRRSYGFSLNKTIVENGCCDASGGEVPD